MFKQDEVCSLTGVKPYVLRFWESEFDEITPIVSSNGQKLYEHKDIEAIALVKKMLFEEKMTIEKAKVEIKLIKNMPVSDEQVPEVPAAVKVSRELKETDIERLTMAKNKLNSVLSMIDSMNLS
jgi:DNA-binding transcriptional MerR regulator